MKERDLIVELKKLQNLNPDQAWKKSAREILHTQILNSSLQTKMNLPVIFSWPQRVFKLLSQPAWAAIMIVAILFGGAVSSIVAAQNTKPGNSLYIAKIISEKAQLAITFDEEKKSKLDLKFTNNHVREITEVLSDPEFNNEDNKNKVAKLSEDFKNEITKAKIKIKEINQNISNIQTQAREEGLEENIEQTNESQAEEDLEIFSANLDKDEKGIELFDPNNSSNNSRDSANSSKIIEENAQKNTILAENASSTLGVVKEELKDGVNNYDEAHKKLEEAERLFDQKEYDQVLNTLNEVENLIKDEKGEVKGVTESATTTVENK